MLKYFMTLSVVLGLLTACGGQDLGSPPDFEIQLVEHRPGLTADIAEDRHGNIFVSTGVYGDRVQKTDAVSTRAWITGLDGAGGVAIDHRDFLYVTEFHTGQVHQYTPSGELSRTYETDIDGPVGLTFGPDGHLYVTEHGPLVADSEAQGRSIYRLNTHSGRLKKVLSDERIRQPVEVAFDSVFNVYISTGSSNTLYRYSPLGQLTAVATIDNPDATGLGWLGIMGGRLYTSTFSTNELYEISPDGTYRSILPEREFSGPNGVSESYAGDSLFMTEGLSGKLNRLYSERTQFDPEPAGLPSVFVTTLTDSLNGPDQVSIGPEGDYYISEYGDAVGTRVLRVDAAGEVTTFIDGLQGPLGGHWTESGDRFCLADASNGEQGVVKCFDNDGTLVSSEILEGWPAGIASDTQGRLYVTNYVLGKIHRLSMDGDVETFLENDQLSGAVGIVLDEQRGFYAANYENGRVFHISFSGDVNELVDLEGGIGYLALGKKALYATDIQNHRIYQVTFDGRASVYAGSNTRGSVDGPGNTATFNRPNGIAISEGTNTIVVTDYGDESGGAIRLLNLSSY